MTCSLVYGWFAKVQICIPLSMLVVVVVVVVGRDHISRCESVVKEMCNETIHFCEQGGLVLEVVVAKYWANLGEVTLDYSLAFHGVKPESPSITMQGADGILSLELCSGLRSEEIAPVVTLKNTVQVVRWATHVGIFFSSLNVFLR
jgi:hypothetical protein